MSEKNKMILGALSMDLKRVALGYHRGSDNMAKKFFEEAIKRRDELEIKGLKPYLVLYLQKISSLKSKGKRSAEDALMYSTIFQNASQ